MAQSTRKTPFRSRLAQASYSGDQRAVLGEYDRMKRHIHDINQHLQSLNVTHLPQLMDTLRIVERQSALVFTLIQSSVYTLISEQAEPVGATTSDTRSVAGGGDGGDVGPAGMGREYAVETPLSGFQDDGDRMGMILDGDDYDDRSSVSPTPQPSSRTLRVPPSGRSQPGTLLKAPPWRQQPQPSGLRVPSTGTRSVAGPSTIRFNLNSGPPQRSARRHP
ncbi:hypothetical protein IWQ60_003111 [Tieghemiomyces parasiticus]|uniref:DASH complex subunit DAD3 n=1 Tax=Tieghemiomyces parasiticus TaxID=78921 RepID=A0A9W8ABF7_9FUNG|nr:hypothetical protein IWQ60_003111 [Tieghemiomyces parasiticus]